MAVGDITFFNEAKAYMLDGGWEATDDMKCMICDNTTAPTAATASPTRTSFTQVGNAGSYTTNGDSIGTWGDMITQTGGAVKFDSATNPTWTQNGSNDTDAYWAVVYNDTDATDRALFFVDLGGPVDMSTGALTITWDASNGIASISA